MKRPKSTARSPAMAEARKWYGTQRWKRRRAAQLAAHPLCAMCLQLGRVTVATVADHLDQHRGDPDKFWNGALQSLCDAPASPWACHSSIKQQRERIGYSTDVGFDGIPLDPNHPFNRG